MNDIPDKFSGYAQIGDDKLAYFVSGSSVTMLPVQRELEDIYRIHNRIIMRNETIGSEFIYGDYSGHKIAMYRGNPFHYDFLGLNPSIQFGTPFIIMACGNAQGYYDRLTETWNRFHSITFYGGNINSVFSPRAAVKPKNNFPNENGAIEIEMTPWDNYTFTKDIELFGQEAKITISIAQSNGNNNSITSGYNIGNLNSIIRFSFNNAQGFEKVEISYSIVKALLALLIRENNISFDVYLSQRLSDNSLNRTAICKIFDPYDNYSNKSDFKVIPLCSIIDFLPNIIHIIDNGEAKPIIPLLSNNNNTRNQITITNVQDMCTALEVAYNWNHGKREKDKLISSLKERIKNVIREFSDEHSEIDVNKQTTISSSFQYLDFTLKEKILTLYSENKEIIDSITTKYSMEPLSENTITPFVKLRNGKTHSGRIEWGNCADYYMPLLTIVYSELFRYAGMPENLIKQLISTHF